MKNISKKRRTRIIRNSLSIVSLVDFIVGFIMILGCAGSYDLGVETTTTKICLVVGIVLILIAGGVLLLLETTSRDYLEYKKSVKMEEVYEEA